MTSPLILHRTTFSCSSLPTLMWGQEQEHHFLFLALVRTRGQKQKRSNRPTKLASCLARPCLRLYILALACALHWYYLRLLRSFLLCRRSLAQARVHHSLPRARALHSLKLQLIQQDCTSLYTAISSTLVFPPNGMFSILCNSNPVGRCGPGQQHERPLPFPYHNGQLLVDPPPFQCCCGWAKEERGRCDNRDRYTISDPSS